MKAQPLKWHPDGSKVFCESHEATHLWIMMPGPFRDRFIPVQLQGQREGTGNWTWNGDCGKPTLKPSVLTWNGDGPNSDRCHTWITDGQAIFLNDCTHALAGQTLDLLDLD